MQKYFSAPEVKVRSYRENDPRWLVYLLDHEYSQKSLSWQGLRGADRHRAAQLLACADSLNLKAHLALADIHESWSAQEQDSRGGYHRDNYYGFEDDNEYADEQEDDDTDGDDSDKYEVDDLIDDEIELRHWVNVAGKRVAKKAHQVDRDMVCWTKAMDEFKPFKSEYEGYQGNWGNTLDRWYHRAAIVLWPKGSEFANLFVIDSLKALQKITKLVTLPH